MALLLVPHRTAMDGARLWAGALTAGGPPGELRLRLLPDERPLVLPADAWRLVRAGGALSEANRRMFVQVAELRNLRPGTRYAVQGDGVTARFSTLPGELPAEGERPFTVLLGSCFHVANDGDRMVGRAVRMLPESHQPDVKILCGDQVYLDLPSEQDFQDNDRWLADAFLGKYARTFFQEGGFSDLLGNGATYFCPDDHEYWNNFPNPSPVVNNSWTEEGRRRWRAIALDLYRDFQSDEPAAVGRPQRFDVGALSFLVADIRTHRGAGAGPLMRPEDLAAMLAWIRGLRGPGVLCLAQPLLDTPGRWLHRTLKDRFLPDYPDYARLCQAIAAAPHSVVALAGDVHFGRVALCELGDGARPRRLVEVIASPSALCHRMAAGRASDAPPFPADGSLGLPRRPTTTVYRTPDERCARDNFATLQFYRRAGRTELAIRYWFPRLVQYGSTQFAELRPIPL